MLKYMSYLFVLIRKRLSTYLIPLFSLIASCGFIYLTLYMANKNGVSGMNSISPFILFIPFIFGGLFIGVKALNIFKDGEIDGTELLIASKQITRTQLVLGKFATLYTLIIGYNVLMFVGAMSVAFSDQYASISDIFLFSGSFAIGGLIIMMLMAAVIAFFASFLGKIGTMTLSIIIPALLPIASFMINPMGNGTLDLSAQSGNYNDYLMNYHHGQFLKNDGENYVKATTGIYSVDDMHQGDIDTKVKKQADGWYKYAAYLDIYQHLNRFYSILEPQEITPSTQAAEWKHVTLNLKNTGAIVLKDNKNKEYFISIPKEINMKNDIKKGIELLNSLNYDAFDVWSKNMLELTNSDQNNFGDDILNNFELTIKDIEEKIDLEKFDSGITDPIMNNFAKEAFALRYYFDHYNGKADVIKWDDATDDHFIQIASPDTKFLEGKRYVSTGAVIGIYLAITVLLSGLVIFRYYRRDFK